MTYIHERPEWPRFHWDTPTLLPLLADVRHLQGHLLGRMESLGFPLRSEANLATITADVLKTSAIEGEILEPAVVRSSIARRLGMDIGGTAPSNRHVEGIVEMMLDATRQYQAPLTVDRLFAWHAALFPTGRSGMRAITVGHWRKPDSDPMQVVSGPIGRERVHFEAPSAARLDAEARMFLQWFEGPAVVDPVLKAAIAHFWFITMHPFEDGNGRISRAIADMALARAEGTPERYYSMSTQIEAEKQQYYETLELCQKGNLDITRWLEWFLACMGRAIHAAEANLAAVLRKANTWEQVNSRLSVNSRQKKIINLLLEGFEGKLTNKKYASINKCSADTALRDIHLLLEHGILELEAGRGRSTSYRLCDMDYKTRNAH